MTRDILATVIMTGLVACSDRTDLHSDAGREFALHLCAIQHDCDCAEDLIIPDCENRVEREFAESEHEAIRAGSSYDADCMESFIARIDGIGACGTSYPESEAPCPVYHGGAELGEPCDIYDLMPAMHDCRVGLDCINGTCRDPNNPTILGQGDICAVEAGVLPTRWLGTCEEGLSCDSLNTRTCVPSTSTPAPLGGACSHPYECLDDGICRPQGEDLQPSEERPGTCVQRTPPGEPCTLTYECDRICEAGRCQVPPPVLCETLSDWWRLRELY